MAQQRERFRMIFTADQIKRISFFQNGNLLIDVHGLSVAQAKRFLLNCLNVMSDITQVGVIHGYKHGTAIKTMLRTDFANRRVSAVIADLDNQGITYLQIA